MTDLTTVLVKHSVKRILEKLGHNKRVSRLYITAVCKVTSLLRVKKLFSVDMTSRKQCCAACL